MTDELPGAGPELDALVMDLMLSGDHLGLENDWWAEHPSTSMRDAMWALEAWQEQHPGIAVGIYLPAYDVNPVVITMTSIGGGFTGIRIEAPTLPVAICHAIVRATREGAR